MATAEARDAVHDLQRERNLPSFSRALGAALEDWLRERRTGVGNPPNPLAWGASCPDSRPMVHPDRAATIELRPWEEVRGVVLRVEEKDGVLVVWLEEFARCAVVKVPLDIARRDQLEPGRPVAILRTDDPRREYRVRDPTALPSART